MNKQERKLKGLAMFKRKMIIISLFLLDLLISLTGVQSFTTARNITKNHIK